MPSAIVGRAAAVTGHAGDERVAVRRAGLDLDADDAHLGPRLLDDAGDPADQPAAAEGDDHRGEVRDVLEQLQAQRRLAGDHVRVVERMDERGAGLGRALARERDAVVDGVAAEVDDAAEAADGGDLGHGRARGHEDLAREPARAGGVGDGLRVVARAAGDDAGAAVAGAELVERAAELERARALEVLRLDEDRAAAVLAEAAAREDGRPADEVGRTGARGMHRVRPEPAALLHRGAVHTSDISAARAGRSTARGEEAARSVGAPAYDRRTPWPLPPPRRRR